MLETFKALTVNQFEAALGMLSTCIDRCPESNWNAPVGNNAFCQVAFHALFWTDFYLEPSPDSFRLQSFHRNNRGFFRNYDELEDRLPELFYDRPTVKAYVDHCRDKVSDVIFAESAETLAAQFVYGRLAVSRAELHVNSLRHVQHHAAQLSLRLRIDTNDGVPWIASGWPDASVNPDPLVAATGDVSLRSVTDTDLPVFFQHQLDSEARQMAAFTREDPADREAFMTHWARIRADDTVTIRTILVDGRVVGFVASFVDEHLGEPEVTYWIGKKYWGRGIATKALSAFLAVQNARPLYARAAQDNVASLRVLEKCGFTVSGHERGFSNAGGQEIDEVILKLR